MKRLFLCFTFLVASYCQSISAASVNVTQIAGFCKVWGFLKYYHPAIQKGSIDWDSLFTSRVPSVIPETSPGAYNSIIRELILAPGTVAKLKRPYQYLPQDTSYNTFDFGWIKAYPLLDDENKKLLAAVIENYVPRENVYIHSEMNRYYSFAGKEQYYYPSDVYPDTAGALLAFSRYWNAVNYLFAYKKLMSENWDSVLFRYTPRMVDAAGKSSFYMVMAEIAAKTNDCHSYYDNYNFNSQVGPVKSVIEFKPVPLEVKMIDGQTVVTFVRTAVAEQAGIFPGDILHEINGMPVERLRDSLSHYCGCSTVSSEERVINAALFRSFIIPGPGPIELLISDASGSKKNVTINWDPKNLRDEWIGYRSDSTVYQVGDSIICMRLAPMSSKEIRKAFRKYRHAKGIILDARNGLGRASLPVSLRLPGRPEGAFANYYVADPKYPGAFILKKRRTSFFGLRLFHRKYRGKVVFLINENDQSSAEFQLMQLKSDFNITLVGDSTSGTDGIASSFLVRENILVYFSTDAVTYPDGRQVQRIGILPDIQARQTAEGIRARKDEILYEAVKFINTAK